MTETFQHGNVTFKYPVGWQLSTDDAGDGWTATLSSTETAFILVSLQPDADDLQQVADETLAALRAEYPDLDAEEVVDTLAGQPAIGHDIDFLTVDTSVTAWTRCIDTLAGPLLVLCQTSEFDRKRNGPVLRAIADSINIDE